MTHHLAYGLAPQSLDIAVVEDSKPMQTVLRSILATMRPARIRVYDSAEAALSSMLQDPPNLIITDWRLGKISGYGLLRMIRQQHMQPLCLVPVIFVTAHATRMHVEKALRGGAQHLLVKPIAPARLQQCISWVLNDAREMEVDGDGNLEVVGVNRRLDQDRERWQTADRARAYHRHMRKLATEFQDQVDSIIDDPKIDDGDVPAPQPEAGESAGAAKGEESLVEIHQRIKKSPPPPKPSRSEEEFGKIIRRCQQVAAVARG